VSVDGGITLCPNFLCDAIPFSTNPLPASGSSNGLLGVYWADVDTGNNQGDVYYHQSNNNPNDAVLDRINEYVEQAYMFDVFDAVEFVIVTWENVGYFGQNNDDKVRNHLHNYAYYQLFCCKKQVAN